MKEAPARYTVEIMVTEINEYGEAHDTVLHIGPDFGHMDREEVKKIAERLNDAATGLFEHLEGATPLWIAPEETQDPEFAAILAELEPVNKALETAGARFRHHVSKSGSSYYQLWTTGDDYAHGKKHGPQKSAKGMAQLLRIMTIEYRP